MWILSMIRQLVPTFCPLYSGFIWRTPIEDFSDGPASNVVSEEARVSNVLSEKAQSALGCSRRRRWGCSQMPRLPLSLCYHALRQ